jgi:hypothetical protein
MRGEAVCETVFFPDFSNSNFFQSIFVRREAASLSLDSGVIGEGLVLSNLNYE